MCEQPPCNCFNRARCCSFWTNQVLTALHDIPSAQQFAAAMRTRARINMDDFETVLREHIINDWRELDFLTPQEAHTSSRVMRTYHTHFGIPLGTVPGWWDDRKRNKKPLLPHYLRQNIPHQLLRSLYGCPATIFEWKLNGIMETGAPTNSEFATNVIGTLCKMRSMSF